MSPARNAKARSMPRDFRKEASGRIRMRRAFQESRYLSWWERIQFRWFGVRWFK